VDADDADDAERRCVGDGRESVDPVEDEEDEEDIGMGRWNDLVAVGGDDNGGGGGGVGKGGVVAPFTRRQRICCLQHPSKTATTRSAGTCFTLVHPSCTLSPGVYVWMTPSTRKWALPSQL
jgi:hypothetical protein